MGRSQQPKLFGVCFVKNEEDIVADTVTHAVQFCETGNMIIEDDVFIGMLVTTANDNLMGRRVLEGKKEWLGKGPMIRRSATIGQGACIPPNIEIGEDSIVGANAVVTKNVAPRTVVMGLPAKCKRNISDREKRG